MTTTSTAAAQLASLEAQLNVIAGRPLALTIRGARAFTFSFNEYDPAAGARVARFFAPMAATTVEADAECGTFVYVDVPDTLHA
ncbi:hypothetical protein [Burkholderia stagnalis]|uniref:Uncharacterized protein n=1 Tax=Burkholderia stagnalis TaxID=1503054 RepID=A0A125KGP3_9BURK|nr:hypothetical protein [Burkholderia stagnalis]KVZ03350.1 hypothetical protein WT35_28060 [Burkholderia stagnalis]KWA48359.1 hypothetical protein WT43_32380 [Burkholderia stagnalis]KWA51685.1 hypothetical protein WT42_16535 [Burkholderia stagnalis]KWA62666.1 hypothetical protein WT44_13635 [Burkholderia stagnalis]KWC98305.1 hypothetical protein WT46_23620 [Burkholderia stagnalis]